MAGGIKADGFGNQRLHIDTVISQARQRDVIAQAGDARLTRRRAVAVVIEVAVDVAGERGLLDFLENVAGSRGGSGYWQGNGIDAADVTNGIGGRSAGAVVRAIAGIGGFCTASQAYGFITIPVACGLGFDQLPGSRRQFVEQKRTLVDASGARRSGGECSVVHAAAVGVAVAVGAGQGQRHAADAFGAGGVHHVVGIVVSVDKAGEAVLAYLNVDAARVVAADDVERSVGQRGDGCGVTDVGIERESISAVRLVGGAHRDDDVDALVDIAVAAAGQHAQVASHRAAATAGRAAAGVGHQRHAIALHDTDRRAGAHESTRQHVGHPHAGRIRRAGVGDGDCVGELLVQVDDSMRNRLGDHGQIGFRQHGSGFLHRVVAGQKVAGKRRCTGFIRLDGCCGFVGDAAGRHVNQRAGIETQRKRLVGAGRQHASRAIGAQVTHHIAADHAATRPRWQRTARSVVDHGVGIRLHALRRRGRRDGEHETGGLRRAVILRNHGVVDVVSERGGIEARIIIGNRQVNRFGGDRDGIAVAVVGVAGRITFHCGRTDVGIADIARVERVGIGIDRNDLEHQLARFAVGQAEASAFDALVARVRLTGKSDVTARRARAGNAGRTGDVGHPRRVDALPQDDSSRSTGTVIADRGGVGQLYADLDRIGGGSNAGNRYVGDGIHCDAD